MAGRDGRDPTAPTQPDVTLANPEGVPAENRALSFDGAYESVPVTIEEGFDNAFADLRFTWGSAAVADWDFYLLDAEGQVVGSAATGGQPEVITWRDPVPGEYTLVVFNYDGGADDDWSGTVTFRGPTPRVVNDPEAWTLTCTDQKGEVKAVKEVVVGRGEVVNVANVCNPGSRAGTPLG
ncbi:hypothetical protein [Aquipuribacter sp. SD81]|uniref:hypothetical protein n=1 Tax=Aquipuribacter sp. SD81 TaxID=3127703 RepID=UPI0030183EEF